MKLGLVVQFALVPRIEDDEDVVGTNSKNQEDSQDMNKIEVFDLEHEFIHCHRNRYREEYGIDTGYSDYNMFLIS